LISKASETPFASYTLTKSASLEVLATQHSADARFEGQKLVLPAGTDLTIISGETDPRYGKILRVGLEVAESDSMPIDFWIRARDLSASRLVPSEMGTGDNSDLWANDDGDLLSDDMFAMATITKTGKRPLRRKGSKGPGYNGVRGRGGMTYCFRYVKQYLLKTGEVPVYLPGVPAWSAESTLPQYGFQVTGHDPTTAGTNEICVYKGGKGGNGHIEIHRPEGWWYGYGFSQLSMEQVSPEKHKFVACYAKSVS
jgi:hypothetical protein